MNCPSEVVTRTNHSPSDGNVTGSDVRTPPAFEQARAFEPGSCRDTQKAVPIARPSALRPPRLPEFVQHTVRWE